MQSTITARQTGKPASETLPGGCYAQSLVEQDSLANLNLRNTEGLGFGYQFFDSRQLSLFTEAGIFYFSKDVKAGEDKSPEIE